MEAMTCQCHQQLENKGSWWCKPQDEAEGQRMGEWMLGWAEGRLWAHEQNVDVRSGRAGSHFHGREQN